MSEKLSEPAVAGKDGGWTLVIKPKGKLWNLELREIWRYRDMLEMYVKRDIKAQYKQTILGPLWYFINPIFTTITYMVVFGGIAGISTDGLPQPLFYLSGTCLWGYFSTCVGTASSTFVANQGIFGKVYFPRIISPLSSCISGLVRLGIQLLLFFIVYAYYLIIGVNIQPNAVLLLFPIFIIELACMGLGFGMIVSSFTTKYRDLGMLFSFVVHLWMYATPIIYPLSTVTNEKLLLAMKLNPVTPIIEGFKHGVMGVGYFSWPLFAYSLIFTVAIFLIGLVIFNKVQRTFMDTV